MGAGSTHSPTVRCPSAVPRSWPRTQVNTSHRYAMFRLVAPKCEGSKIRRSMRIFFCCLYSSVMRAWSASSCIRVQPCCRNLICFLWRPTGIGRHRSVAPSYMGSSDWSKGRENTAPDFTKVKCLLSNYYLNCTLSVLAHQIVI